MARTYHIIKCELLRLHSSFDGHEQCCLHGAWMNLLLLCSLYPAACLRDHSPPLPLFHPERKNLQRVCRFECWPRTLPQHQNQNAISHAIKPTMIFFQSWNSKRVSFFQTIRVRSYFVTSWYVHLRILTFESWDFFLGRLLRRVKKSAVTSRTRVFSRILLNIA